MSNFLVNGLAFEGNDFSTFSTSQFLLVTDHLASPADFLVHRALALSLKRSSVPGSSNSRVLLVSFANDFSHWSAIASKSNINIRQHLKNGSFSYVDGLSVSGYNHGVQVERIEECGPVDPIFSSKTGRETISLKLIYEAIVQSLRNSPPSLEDIAQTSNTKGELIIDDITILEYIGVPPIEISRFLRALRALCNHHSMSLLVRAHASPLLISSDSSPFDSKLLKNLLETCHVHLEVRPLTSGRSGAISGEITVHRGGFSGDVHAKGTGRKAAIHYRLTEGSATFFQKGMSAGVL